jgi:two-component sensor histidine kinase
MSRRPQLGANAVRHGALSAPSGRVTLSWVPVDSAILLDWRERGGPAVAAPERKGFGRQLLNAGLAGELGAGADMTFAPEGLTCRIRVPAGERAR